MYMLALGKTGEGAYLRDSDIYMWRPLRPTNVTWACDDGHTSRKATKADSQYYAKQCVALRRFLVDPCRNATRRQDRLGSYPCVAFLRLVVKKSPTFWIINLCVSRINAMQGLASLWNTRSLRSADSGIGHDHRVHNSDRWPWRRSRIDNNQQH